MKRIVCASLVSSLLAAGPAQAVNYQDLWWNPLEDGWGLQIVQQADTLFLTWFIYNSTGQPTWVVSDGVARVSSSPPNVVYRGRVVAATGTFFGAPIWSGITPRVVGTDVTLSFTGARAGTITYTVDGVTVSKPITRQNLVPINIAGTYQGGIYRAATGCSNANNNGTRLGDPTTFSVTHTAATNALEILEIGGTSCRFTGTFVQFGSSFEGSGGYTCMGETGTWTGVEGTQSETTFGFKMALRPTGEVCTINAVIGGFKQPAG